MSAIAQAPGLTRPWAFTLAVLSGGLVWLLGWYRDTAWAMVSIWIRSETFAHGFVIVPICIWLVWRERRSLAAMTPRPNYWMLVPVALAGAGWLLGTVVGAGVVQQFGLALMIVFTVWTALGNRMAWALAFPLAYLLFAVPFGESLEPLLMEHTADFTVAALRLSGIPVFREGQFFTIPSGSWSVVEACSGLRYLIASVTLGCLYAYLTYRGLLRRALFVLASILVPIVANWLRAYMIVMIGHLSSMKYAVGVDHLIYGWLFFGLVMLILFWIGAYWREDIALRPAPPAPAAAVPQASVAAAVLAAVLATGAWPLLAGRMESGNAPPPQLRAPAGSGAWQAVSGHGSGWQPQYANPSAEIVQSYANGSEVVELRLAWYQNQRPGRQIFSSQNVLAPTIGGEWRVTSAELERTLSIGGRPLSLIQTQLAGRSARLLVWNWYWVDGRATTSPYWGKLLQAKSVLLGGGDDAVLVALGTPLAEDPQQAAARLEAFTETMLPAIDATLENARQHRSAP
ncbi:MAG: exosortase A [Burkholderiales bacterium]|nr:exosortase A [Burkholderiales bacterium]